MAISLPEELMEHIFSFLAPKDLIQTSLLSKRWRNFWASVPCTTLSFNVGNSHSMYFFHRFLQSRRTAASPTVLQRLTIQRWTLCESRFFNLLIASALDHHVQDLYIYDYQIFPFIFSAPNLTNLKLQKVSLLGGYDVAELPITCPDLESLILWDCGDLLCSRGLALHTRKLKRLEVKHIVNNCDLELHTPKLSSFSYGCRNPVGECFSFGHGSLECWFGKVDAWDNVDGWFNTCRIANILQGLKLCQLPLERASHARVSAIGSFATFEGITSALGRLLKSYSNLRSLELSTSLQDAVDATQLASLLISSCSSIEVLALKVDYYVQTSDTTELPELPLQFTLNKLKYIAVQGVEGLDCELEFFTLLLIGAVNFKRMVIIEAARKYFNHKRCVLKQFRKKLSKQFPGACFSIQLL